MRLDFLDRISLSRRYLDPPPPTTTPTPVQAQTCFLSETRRSPFIPPRLKCSSCTFTFTIRNPFTCIRAQKSDAFWRTSPAGCLGTGVSWFTGTFRARTVKKGPVVTFVAYTLAVAVEIKPTAARRSLVIPVS